MTSQRDPRENQPWASVLGAELLLALLDTKEHPPTLLSTITLSWHLSYIFYTDKNYDCWSSEGWEEKSNEICKKPQTPFEMVYLPNHLQIY